MTKQQQIRSLRCISCDAPVSPQDRICGECEHPLQKQCPNLDCGRWSKYANIVCPSCGTRLHTGSSYTHNKNRKDLQEQQTWLLGEIEAQKQWISKLYSKLIYAVQRFCVVIVSFVLLFLFVVSPVYQLLAPWGYLGLAFAIIALGIGCVPLMFAVRMFVWLCKWGSILTLVRRCQDIPDAWTELETLRQQLIQVERTLYDLDEEEQPSKPDAETVATPVV
jgi:hypothetical protein